MMVGGFRKKKQIKNMFRGATEDTSKTPKTWAEGKSNVLNCMSKEKSSIGGTYKGQNLNISWGG